MCYTPQGREDGYPYVHAGAGHILPVGSATTREGRYMYLHAGAGHKLPVGSATIGEGR